MSARRFAAHGVLSCKRQGGIARRGGAQGAVREGVAVHQLLEDHRDHVFVVWLPTYSPELNLIEGLWGYLKRSALNNYFYGEIESLGAAIHEAFSELQQHPETALSLAYKMNTNLRKTA